MARRKPDSPTAIEPRPQKEEAAMSSTAETTSGRPATPAPERDAIRAFLGRALADDALDDEVKQLLFDHVVEERLDRPALTEGLVHEFRRLIATATPEDWQAVSDDLVAEAREVVAALHDDSEATGRPEDTTTVRAPLRFIDHHRQHYAGKVPIAEAAEFIIGSYNEDGSLDEDGEIQGHAPRARHSPRPLGPDPAA